jgi:hypothetical protein
MYKIMKFILCNFLHSPLNLLSLISKCSPLYSQSTISTPVPCICYYLVQLPTISQLWDPVWVPRLGFCPLTGHNPGLLAFSLDIIPRGDFFT